MNPATPALLMVHGLMGPINFLEPQQRLPGIELHAPDLPGYGAQPLQGAADGLSLDRQAGWVAEYLRSRVRRPAVLLVHSVGGAIAMLVAGRVPELVGSVINVEGNFSLNDAFWCRGIAAMGEDGWRVAHRALQADPEAWLKKGGIRPDAQRLQWAQRVLHNQCAATVQGMARAVVRETGDPAYLAAVQQVLDRGTTLHLLAGKRSASGCDVPDWVRSAAASSTVLPGVGHMMMLEAPQRFCEAVAGLVGEGAPHGVP